jgi:endonuclease-3
VSCVVGMVRTFDRKKQALTVVNLLERQYPNAMTALNFSNPLELLVATILSAQCTDKKVNMVTEQLFKNYKTAEDYANASIKKLEQEIRPTGFYHNKAKNIVNCCQVLTEKFDSKVPKTMEDVLQLPGVGRKTANIVLAHAYGVVVGVAVDTHVRRVTERLGLTDKDSPDKIEKDLMKIVPQAKWVRITDLLISLGRQICVARKPKCEICVLNKVCPSAFTFG